jgi:effector-binding domain-containing protein
LKTMAEAAEANKTYRGYKIKEIDFPSRTFLAKRGTISFSEVPSFFGKNLPVMFAELGKAGLQPAGAPCGLYFSWNPETQKTDMAAALPLAPGTTPPTVKGTEQIKAEGKALQLSYYGDYQKLEIAHGAIDDYMKEKNIEWNNLTIEEYITDPKAEPDTAKWLTNIYYLIK